MKELKNKKKIIIILICICICFLGVCCYTIFFKLNPIQETEISILQINLKIEPNKYMVVLPKNSEEQQNTQNNSSTNKNSKSKKTNKTGTNGSNVSYTSRIQIPRTKINYVIYSDMTRKNMEKGVVILYSDNGLNQPGNTVISGHNYGNRKLFSQNHKIQPGDLIYITDYTGQKITYSVYSKYYTSPNDANYMDRNTNGNSEISLTTCTLDSSQRLIILAKQI